MGLLSSIIAKSVATAARNSTIKAVGAATANVISAKAKNSATKEEPATTEKCSATNSGNSSTKKRTTQEHVVVKDGIVFIKPTRSSEEYVNADALEVVAELLAVGFESVTLKPVQKLNKRGVKKYGRIQSISINGNSDFAGTRRIRASSYILIKYLDFKSDVEQEVYADMNLITPGTISGSTKTEIEPEKSENLVVDEDKKFCSYCGKPIQSIDARFCSYCGKELV